MMNVEREANVMPPKGRPGRGPPTPQYEYDAYIAHSEQDKEIAWELTQALEEKKFRCYLAVRDALPGSLIPTQVFRNMDRSRTVILVIGDSPIEDTECQFQYECKGAALHSLGHPKVLVPILHNIKPDLIPPWLKSYRCLHYDDEHFWSTLCNTLRGCQEEKGSFKMYLSSLGELFIRTWKRTVTLMLSEKPTTFGETVEETAPRFRVAVVKPTFVDVHSRSILQHVGLMKYLFLNLRTFRHIESLSHETLSAAYHSFIWGVYRLNTCTGAQENLAHALAHLRETNEIAENVFTMTDDPKVKIQAAKIICISKLLTDESESKGAASCMNQLRKVHELNEVKEAFEMLEALPSEVSGSHKRLIWEVCYLNSCILELLLRIGATIDPAEWPCIGQTSTLELVRTLCLVTQLVIADSYGATTPPKRAEKMLRQMNSGHCRENLLKSVMMVYWSRERHPLLLTVTLRKDCPDLLHLTLQEMLAACSVPRCLPIQGGTLAIRGHGVAPCQKDCYQSVIAPRSSFNTGAEVEVTVRMYYFQRTRSFLRRPKSSCGNVYKPASSTGPEGAARTAGTDTGGPTTNLDPSKGATGEPPSSGEKTVHLHTRGNFNIVENEEHQDACTPTQKAMKGDQNTSDPSKIELIDQPSAILPIHIGMTERQHGNATDKIEIANQQDTIQVETLNQPDSNESSDTEPTDQPDLSEPSQMEPSDQPDLIEPSQMEPNDQPDLSEPSQMEPNDQPDLNEPSQMEPNDQPDLSEPSQMEPNDQPDLSEPCQMEPTDQPDLSEMEMVALQNALNSTQKVMPVENACAVEADTKQQAGPHDSLTEVFSDRSGAPQILDDHDTLNRNNELLQKDESKVNPIPREHIQESQELLGKLSANENATKGKNTFEDMFDMLPDGPDPRYTDELEQMQTIEEDLKKILRPALYRGNTPWKDTTFLMGLDDDLKYKVWIPTEYKDLIYKEIEKTINKTFENNAAEYLKHVEVVGLKKPFTFHRDAGISILPGLKLIFANDEGARLTGFFTDGEDVYAVSTSHLDDLTGRPVWCEAGMGRMPLGEVVCHVAEGEPFREACLIKVDEDRLDDISEYVVETTDAHIYVDDIYRGGPQHISTLRPKALMNCGDGQFHAVKFKARVDRYDRGTLLKDCVLWAGEEGLGREGESGAAFYGKSGRNVDLVAMYIGHGTIDNEELLVSHTMCATVDYFNESLHRQLQVYNPRTRPVTGADFRRLFPEETYFDILHDVRPILKPHVAQTKAHHVPYSGPRHLTRRKKVLLGMAGLTENIPPLRRSIRTSMSVPPFQARYPYDPVLNHPALPPDMYSVNSLNISQPSPALKGGSELGFPQSHVKKCKRCQNLYSSIPMTACSLPCTTCHPLYPGLPVTALPHLPPAQICPTCEMEYETFK